jgi:diguanylate cyclase (GGDEF)-like protein
MGRKVERTTGDSGGDWRDDDGPVTSGHRDLELSEALHGLLYGLDPGVGKLTEELQRLEDEYHDLVYSELVYLMSHLQFEPAEAKAHWERVQAHRQTMAEALGQPVDLRVALVSYFVEVNRKLRNPKVIELALFEQTQASAYRDELTGLCNYRLFREHLAREVERSVRHSSPLTLAMVDIDDFKTYNDRNGHESGNEALRTIAEVLVRALRGSDIAARYGGEEFALILPSTTKAGARIVAERARRDVEKQPFAHEAGQPNGSLTVSLGIATCPADATDAGGLIRCADSAMYVAKNRGKNQVHLYGQDRRSYRRVHAALDGTFCLLAAEYHPLTTLNVSAGGLLFIAKRELPLGTLVAVTIRMPGYDHEINASGRVVRVEEKGDGTYEAALRILDMPTTDQAALVNYLRDDETLSNS